MRKTLIPLRDLEQTTIFLSLYMELFKEIETNNSIPASTNEANQLPILQVWPRFELGTTENK